MSYNIKNKKVIVVAVACLFVVLFGYGRFSDDANAQIAEAATEAIQDQTLPEEDVFGLDTDETSKQADEAKEVTENAAEKTAESLDFLDEETADDVFDAPVETSAANSETSPAQQPADDDLAANDDLLTPPPAEDDMGIEELEAEERAVTAEIEAQENAVDAPKSPFESFGNAILSKVDNDLFNQMSNIEKQNTILNLQLKREELRNKVAALRAAREQAKLEAEARRIAEEQKIKDMEAERQAKILEAERLLREKEMELEKVRQGKIINDYMNQMLIMNQKWIEKNAELQSQILELREERKTLVKNFEEKLDDLLKRSREVKENAQVALTNHQNMIDTFNSQIEQLKQSVVDAESRLRQAQSDAENPFAEGSDAPGRDAIDMAQEYAIMDITGKGKDIVAKIVNREGTTFIVHKGSMLKGGEVVTNITETYIAFDNRGVKSYLYTGGSVLEYEPTKSFNGSDKTPEETKKQSIRGEIRNVMGAEGVDASEGSSAPVVRKNNDSSSSRHTSSSKGSAAAPKSTSSSGSSSGSGSSSSSSKSGNSSSSSKSGNSSNNVFPTLGSGMFVK